MGGKGIDCTLQTLHVSESYQHAGSSTYKQDRDGPMLHIHPSSYLLSSCSFRSPKWVHPMLSDVQPPPIHYDHLILTWALVPKLGTKWALSMPTIQRKVSFCMNLASICEALRMSVIV